MKSVLNKSISYYPNITSTANGIVVNLLNLLSSNRHKEKITHLRHASDEIQKQLKLNLPCYTVAGTFSRRCEDGIINPSGLASVDLDSAENYDTKPLLKELTKINCIAYVGLSCRGKRLFCIIPFLFPEKYQRHYERLIQSFNDIGLPMGDECHKQISQPRFVSWNDDSTQFFNHEAIPYHLLIPEKKFHFLKCNYNEKAITTLSNPFQWCVDQVNKSYSFIKGQRHNYLVHLVRYCNLKGIEIAETTKGCLNFIEQEFEESEIRKIVNHIYQRHKESFNSHPFKK
mgnify:CR=1 FL=1